MSKTILITGGAGFVGSNLAVHLKNKMPADRVIALDNLKRRGSELNLPRLKEAGVEFMHGDIRNKEDLAFSSMTIDRLIECSAEPSVLAGFGGSPDYVINTNLVGAINCLELARQHGADLIFLSTSRVYPMARLNELEFVEDELRFVLAEDQTMQGVSRLGIAEDFPLSGARSLYGVTKLAAELLIHEYVQMYGLKAVINRCGVIAGPWQMGKVDQGVFSLWLAAHYFKKELRYIGFGGQGKQVRDLLHIADLCELIDLQIGRISELNGQVFNVGGGLEVSLSLSETTRLCQKITGNQIAISGVAETRPADVKFYISDNTRVAQATDWQPKRSAEQVLSDVFDWVRNNERSLRGILGG